MKTDTWLLKSKFVERMYRVMGAPSLDVVVYYGVPLKDCRARHIYRNRTDWIYVRGFARSPVVHELVHAIRRAHHNQFPVKGEDEYDHDPEEYEAMWWEMEYLRSTGLKKQTVLRRMTDDGPYPKGFYEALFTTKLGGSNYGKIRWKRLDRWKLKSKRGSCRYKFSKSH